MTGKRKDVVFIEWCPHRQSKARKSRPKRASNAKQSKAPAPKPKAPLTKPQRSSPTSKAPTNITKFITPWAMHTMSGPGTSHASVPSSTSALPWPNIATITGTNPTQPSHIGTGGIGTHMGTFATNSYPTTMNTGAYSNGMGFTMSGSSPPRTTNNYSTSTNSYSSTLLPPQKPQWDLSSVPMLPVASSNPTLSPALSSSVEMDLQNFSSSPVVTPLTTLNEFTPDLSQPSDGLDSEHLGIYSSLRLGEVDISSSSWPDISLVESPMSHEGEGNSETSLNTEAGISSLGQQTNSTRASIAGLELLKPLDNINFRDLRTFEPFETESLSSLAALELELASYANMGDLSSIRLDSQLGINDATITPANSAGTDTSTAAFLWDDLTPGSADWTLNSFADISSPSLQLSDGMGLADKRAFTTRDSGIALDDYETITGLKLQGPLLNNAQGVGMYSGSTLAQNMQVSDLNTASMSGESHGREQMNELLQDMLERDNTTYEVSKGMQNPTLAYQPTAGSITGRARSSASVSTCGSDVENSEHHSQHNTPPGAHGHADIHANSSLSSTQSASAIIKATGSAAPVSGEITCGNCGIFGEKKWHRSESGGNLCNACVLYWKVKGKVRPPHLAKRKLTRLVRKRLSGGAKGLKKNSKQNVEKTSGCKTNEPSQPVAIATSMATSE
ncbi:hypothetical protein SARC_11506 [Sphaeroforma arctica JP610]|uniref:GATA-type domain-containing protein n=1 Tax=Sphaeroforma arctica JP610 TaxID=667725 RepID=A0A0L0FHN6_9EUKA|nr:hypothetical protein SARC_11506 [Sphaeroforma arctica JP610]KNC75981.1 hypothetical protein SARC_11506 [Sphaeroforma arctica JP610]|eukprot:XP_014149883.1 hypothetical protein SARC_11506 [Sphaeroforma arctica JP610]